MFIEIQSRDFALTAPLRSHIRRRLNFALCSKSDYIQRVRVWLSDENGPRGGNDKCCRLQILMHQTQGIVIEDTQSDLYNAIDRAANRASNTIGRRISRLRDLSRSEGQPVFSSARN